MKPFYRGLIFCLWWCNFLYGKAIFRIARDIEFSGFDPIKTFDKSVVIINEIYDGLFEVNEKGEVVPALVEKYSVDSTRRIWTFYLRRNVYFAYDKCFSHSGKIKRKLTAYDVEYSFKRLMQWVRVPAPIKQLFSKFYAKDEHQFVIELNEPFSPLKSLLAMHIFKIVPKEAVEYYGDEFYLHPVGTGPFKLAHWIKESELVLVSNENYWILICLYSMTNLYLLCLRILLIGN